MIEQYNFLFIISGVIFGFMIRLPLFYIYNDSDQWGVLTKLKRMKEKKWISYDVHDSLLKGNFPYPMFTYYLVSRFPPRFWRIFSITLCVLPDLILAVATYFTSIYFISGKFDIYISNYIALLTMMLYLTLPVLFPRTARLKATNGRTLGMLFVLSSFISIACFIETGGWLWLFFAYLLSGLTILTSIFATQELIFVSLLFSIFYLSPIPFLVVLAVVLTGFLFPQIGIRDVLLFKFSHHLFYKKAVKNGVIVLGRNLLPNFFLVFYYLFKNRKKALELILDKSPLMIVSYSILPIWMLAYTLFKFPNMISYMMGNPVNKFLLFLVTANIFLFILTSTKRFSVLGESERYTEYAAPAIVLISITPAISLRLVSPNILVIMLILQIAFIIILHLQPHFKKSISGNDRGYEEVKLSHFLLNLPFQLKIATLPIKLPILLSTYTTISLKTNKPILYYYRFMFDQDNIRHSFDTYINEVETIDIFKLLPDQLMKLYKINCIIAEKKYFSYVQYPFIEALTKMIPVYSSSRYNVYLMNEKELNLVPKIVDKNIVQNSSILHSYIKYSYNYASLLKSKREFEEAQKIFMKILEVSSQHLSINVLGGIYFHLGEISLILGKRDSAKNYFLLSVHFIPNHKKASAFLKRIAKG